MSKENKLNKSTKAILFEFDKHTLDAKEAHIKHLIDTLIEYGFTEVAHQAVGYNELWLDEIQRNHAMIEKSTLPKEIKSKLNREIMPIFSNEEEIKAFEESGLSQEQWNVKRNIEFADKRIKILEETLNHLTNPIKEKIINDLINKKLFWYESLGVSGKISNAIKEHNKKAK